MELQLDVSVPPFPHTLGLVSEVSPSLPVQYGGRGGGVYEKQEGLGPTHMPSLCPMSLSLFQEARTTYRRILQESARKLNTQGSHLGSCIEKARPYYEARRLAKEVWPADVHCRMATCRPGPGLFCLCVEWKTGHFLISFFFYVSSLWFMSLFFAHPFILYPFPPLSLFFKAQILWVHYWETVM